MSYLLIVKHSELYGFSAIQDKYIIIITKGPFMRCVMQMGVGVSNFPGKSITKV